MRMIKRASISKKQSSAIRLMAVFFALIMSGLFILLMGHNPIEVYISMAKGAFGSIYRIKDTITLTIPLVITSMGIMIAFKMKFWNIGAEGQILMGGLFASYIALNYSFLPKVTLLLLMFIVGFIGGGLWALIPALLKVKFDTNETIVTLMMNYIALQWITFLQYGPWKDPKSMGFPKIANFSSNAVMPKILGIHIGWIFALLLVAIIYFVFKSTKQGYQITVVGESKDTARYSGINVNKVLIIAMIFSGGLCGITGMMQASAVNQTLNTQLAAGYGYTAIITTWLTGLNPLLIVPVSLLFAAMTKGGSFIQTAFQIPQSAAQIIQSVILFFVIGSEFFIQYKLVFSKLLKKEDMA